VSDRYVEVSRIITMPMGIETIALGMNHA